MVRPLQTRAPQSADRSAKAVCFRKEASSPQEDNKQSAQDEREAGRLSDDKTSNYLQ